MYMRLDCPFQHPKPAIVEFLKHAVKMCQHTAQYLFLWSNQPSSGIFSFGLPVPSKNTWQWRWRRQSKSLVLKTVSWRDNPSARGLRNANYSLSRWPCLPPPPCWHCSLLEDCCLVKPSSRALFHCVAGCSLSANPLLQRNSIVRAAINISWNSCLRAKEPISDTFRILHLVTQRTAVGF